MGFSDQQRNVGCYLKHIPSHKVCWWGAANVSLKASFTSLSPRVVLYERMLHVHPIELIPLILLKFRINLLCHLKLALFHPFIVFLASATYIFRLVEDQPSSSFQ